MKWLVALGVLLVCVGVFAVVSDNREYPSRNKEYQNRVAHWLHVNHVPDGAQVTQVYMCDTRVVYSDNTGAIHTLFLGCCGPAFGDYVVCPK